MVASVEYHGRATGPLKLVGWMLPVRSLMGLAADVR